VGSGHAGQGGAGQGGAGQGGAAGEGSGGAGSKACSVAADCAVVSPCTVPVCQGGVCGVENVAKGVAVGGLVLGCQLPLCDGQGGVELTKVACECVPGAVRCNEDNQRQACAADGTWEPGVACPQSAPVCSQVACTTVAQITTRNANSCALLGDGRVRCWGADPIEAGNKAWRPVPIEGIEGAVAVAAGDAHSCAIDQAGAVRCWGENQWQQTGAADAGFTATPHRVDGLSGIKKLALGGGFTCALGDDGAVWCWGKRPASGVFEGLGKPLKMPLPPAVEIVAGWRHMCAKTTDGDAYCWGSGELGQLGNSKLEDSVNPVLAGAIGDLSLSAGDDVTCAHGHGVLRCWGFLAAAFPEAGLESSPSPLALPHAAEPFNAVAIGHDFACAQAADGPLVCQGDDSQLQFGAAPAGDHLQGPATVPLAGAITSFVAGGSHACALLSSGAVVCWGQNADAQLGIGLDTLVAPPTAVAW
jgi:alpha-tubulin suppressor-like RCC1 family protein